MTDNRFQLAINKYAGLFLLAGLLCEVIRQLSYPLISNQTIVLVNLNRWMWLLTMLGFGYRFLNKNNSVLKYLSSASFPFYIFHLLLNTIAGYYIVQLPFGTGIKYSMIVVSTILSTFVVCEIVKRIPGIRFVFGVKNVKQLLLPNKKNVGQSSSR